MKKMDEIVISPSLKSQKLLDGQISGEGEDRISNLPDGILGHILDFLPTKDVLGTCILSKRWQFAWTTISNIDFDVSSNFWMKRDDPFSLEEWTSFLGLVDKVLVFTHSKLKKVRLCHITGAGPSRVVVWICAALARGAEELCVANLKDDSVFPHCFSFCESLTVLKLEMDCPLIVPNSVCFPNLRTFHISSATFMDDNSTQRLFSGCPVLQELSLTQCEWKYIKSITIAIPTLTTLTIDYMLGPEDILDCELKICAERLMYFNCLGNLIIKILLCNVLSLVDAFIGIDSRWGNPRELEVAQRELNLFAGIRTVRSLTISFSTFEALFLVEDIVSQLPMFTNLTYLEFNEMTFDYRILKIFLQHSPNLKSLTFSEGVDTEYTISSIEAIEPVPQCLRSHFSRFSIEYFYGYEAEIQLVQFFLQNAVVLKEVELCCAGNLCDDMTKQEEVRDLLNGLPRSSADSVIVMSF